MNIHFSHQVSAVAVYCVRAYTQMLRCFAVRQSTRYTLQNFAFAIGQLAIRLTAIQYFLNILCNNSPSLKYATNSIRDFFRRSVLKKKPMDTCINQVRKHTFDGLAGYDDELGLRRPFFTFQKNFQTIGARHRKINNCAIWAQKLNFRYGINPIGRAADDFEFNAFRNKAFHALYDKWMIIRDKYGIRHTALRATRNIVRLASCWIVLIVSITAPASGETHQAITNNNVLVLDGAKTSQQLQPYIHYYLDEKWERTIPEILGEYADKFKLIETQDPDFGYTNSKIWLRINLKNTSELTENWRLYFKENFKQLFDVYIIRKNFSVENVLSQDLERGFNSRPIQFPELVAPLLIEPGSEVTVLVNYWSEGASYMQLSLESVSSFEEIASARTAKNFVYYGVMLVLIGAALLSLLIFWHVVFAAYIAYATSTLIFLMHSDGVAYQYLWPSFPQINSVASIFIGSALIISACNYARVFLITKRRHPLVNMALLLVIVVTSGLFFGHFFFDNQFIKRALVFMSLIAVISCALAAVIAALKRFKEVRFFLFAWIGVVLAALIMNLRHQFGVEISQDVQNDLIRIAMVLEAAMIGLAIADRYNQSQNARQSALKESLTIATRNLQLNKRLSDLEEQFSSAMAVASDQSREFANTIHDLKQPIHALRLKVHSLTESAGKSDANSNVEETFEYLEHLVSSHLQGNTQEMVNHDLGHDGKNASDLSLNEVLESVHQMFLPDAKAKGLEFSYVTSTLHTDFPNLDLMRIATNLVSNAVKYTSSGKILMGCRRGSNRVLFEVHDTGPGMNAEEFKLALERSVRLEGKNENSGNGYGLSIVSELANAHNLQLTRCRNRTTGFGVRVELPRK